MGQLIVHFEILGQDPQKLRSFYGDLDLDLKRSTGYTIWHLVYGKPAKIRHCPATVNAENSRSNTTGLTPARAGFLRIAREGISNSKMRESGDRPDANLGFIQFRWESWRAFPCRSKHAPAMRKLPTI